MSILRLTLLAFGLIGWLLASPSLSEEPRREKVAVVGATVEGLRVIPPVGDRMVNVQQPKGSLRQVKVALVEIAYRLDLAQLRENKLDIDTGTMRCYEIRSLEPDLPYCWAIWTPEGLFNLRLFTDPAGGSFLGWVHPGAVVSFEDVSQPNDRLEALTRRLNVPGTPMSQAVQLRPLIPEVINWGVNALYWDVRLVSLRKRDDGTFALVVSNPDGTKLYTIVGQGGDWRLAEPGEKAGPATGKPEAATAAVPNAPAPKGPEPKAEETKRTDQ
jgi:hypothetical protein